MPLLLDMKSGDKLIINGAVIENSGANTKILVHNESAILRGKEILSDEQAVTPASRTYFALQCAYIFPAHREKYLKQFERLLNDYLSACPSAESIAQAIRKEVDQGRLYAGMKKARDLIKHEADTLAKFDESMAEMLDVHEDDPPGSFDDPPP